MSGAIALDRSYGVALMRFRVRQARHYTVEKLRSRMATRPVGRKTSSRNDRPMPSDTQHFIGQHQAEIAAPKIADSNSTQLCSDMQFQVDELRRELRSMQRERRFCGGVLMGLGCVLSACIARSQNPTLLAPTTPPAPSTSTAMKPSKSIRYKRPVSAPRPSFGLLKMRA